LSRRPSKGTVTNISTARSRRTKSSGPPLKRKPRKHSKEAKRRAAGAFAEFLAEWEPLHEVAAVLPQWEPGDRGRPPDLPPAGHLLFGIIYVELGNDRDAQATFDYAPTWHAVRRSLAERYPGYRGLRPDAQPISRREFWRFRERHGITDEILHEMRVAVRGEAATQALAQGMFDPGVGSFTHPALQNIFVGDGTVAPPHYKGTPSGRQLNRETGELEPVKYDPDANYYMTGDGEKAFGLKVGFVEAFLPYDDERVEGQRLILDVFDVRHEPGYDEAAQAVKSFEALVELLPGAQAVEWDMALRGTHFDATRRLGLVDIVKVPVTTAEAGKQIPAPKDKHQRHQKGHVFTLRDGTEEEHSLFTIDGHPHFEGVAEGMKVAVPLARNRIRRIGNRIEGFRLYGDYHIPADPRVPQRLRSATVTVRLSRTEDDKNYNRAEHLRPITIHDPVRGPHADPDHESEFDQLYVLRPGAESINRWFKQRWTDGRAPAVGRHRFMFMLLCGVLLNNAKDALAHEQRRRRAA
jgi:hypothetical protein